MDKEWVVADVNVGRLCLRERDYDPRPSRKRMAAFLGWPDSREGFVIPPLQSARVVKIIDRGVLIAGFELRESAVDPKSIRRERFAQTWWCLPVLFDETPAAGPAALPGAKEDWRMRSSREYMERIGLLPRGSV
ncbi:hypothetical protein DFR41_110144 [Pseudacidovorax intermedius]|uniref:Uncharacterized protein n=1 Tax=Pseudacidovorax intermedius TaxID=433924 RepID=A0A370F886_9BURK|nr:hypothetical protein [Pseudacidovorax intermedius]RDI20736.1 hypothetical protein DFR41_110144 [Pseudacidovorax intermedius]